MFKDEFKNWKWAAIIVYHIYIYIYIYIYVCVCIYIKKIVQFPSHSVYSTTETSKGISQYVHKICVLTSVRIRRKHTLPPLRLISWAFGGRQTGIDPTGHIIAEKELEWMYWALLHISEGLSNRMSGKCKSWSATAPVGEEWDIIKWSCNLWTCNLPRTNI